MKRPFPDLARRAAVPAAGSCGVPPHDEEEPAPTSGDPTNENARPAPTEDALPRPAVARMPAQLLALLLVFLSVTATTPRAQNLPPRKDAVDLAVDNGVAFLLTQQRPDGSFVDQRGRDQHHSVMTALALMSMASVGHLPSDQTVEGASMRRAIDFLTREDRQDQEGYFGRKDGSRMYGHGIITLSLSEMLGMGVNKQQDGLIRQRCVKAVELILRSQRVRKHSVKFQGGWRYTPTSGDADLSVTVWQTMALRSAKNAGMPVPKQAIDEAVKYLKLSYKSSRDASGNPTDMKSGFGYQPGRGPEFATAAAGLLALQVCGEYEAPEVIGVTDWLLDLTHAIDARGRPRQSVNYSTKWFFYGMYYYSQGMQKRGKTFAQRASQFTRGLLLPKQDPDGAWISGDSQERSAGRIYSTSMAILCLSVKYHYLPIFQY